MDVGCGYQPKGDINTDIAIVKAPNFVRADGSYLPFRENCFDAVISQNVIEHVAKPFVFLSELSRVAKESVIISFPHRLGDAKTNWDRQNISPHVNVLNVIWFQQVAEKLGLLLQKEEIGYRHWPFLSNTINQYLGFIVRLPAQITITLRKPQL